MLEAGAISGYFSTEFCWNLTVFQHWVPLKTVLTFSWRCLGFIFLRFILSQPAILSNWFDFCVFCIVAENKLAKKRDEEKAIQEGEELKERRRENSKVKLKTFSTGVGKYINPELK